MPCQEMNRLLKIKGVMSIKIIIITSVMRQREHAEGYDGNSHFIDRSESDHQQFVNIGAH